MTLVTTQPRQWRRTLTLWGVALVLLAALLTGLMGGLIGSYLGWTLAGGDQPEVDEVAAASLTPVNEAQSGSVASIASAVLPSVVFIAAEGQSQSGVGSGFVISEDGYIVTNNHVVQSAATNGSISVEFSDGRSEEAEVIGGDASYDIAVLKVDVQGLRPLAFADSEDIQVGMPVVAVGAPLGLDSTVTSGIVSARDRPVTAGDPQNPAYINAIQTDAAINPGNSGGPLLNGNGEVIGVNSAIAQMSGTFGSGGNIGLGFAIPSAQAERTANQLIETGSSDHPVMGVLVDLEYSGQGARVLEDPSGDAEPVTPGGPADEAGIQPGEVIVEVDGQQVDDSRHLIVLLRSAQVGQTVEVVVEHEAGQERTVDVTLQGSQ